MLARVGRGYRCDLSGTQVALVFCCLCPSGLGRSRVSSLNKVMLASSLVTGQRTGAALPRTDERNEVRVTPSSRSRHSGAVSAQEALHCWQSTWKVR